MTTDIDAERDMEIDTLRDVLADALANTQASLREAEHALDQLGSNRLYDVEYAESTTSSDLRHLLAEASRAVRIALVLKREIESRGSAA